MKTPTILFLALLPCFLSAAPLVPMEDPLGEVKVNWPTIETPEQDPISGITNYSQDYLDWMLEQRRDPGNTSVFALYPGVIERAKYYVGLMESEGAAALARAMVDAYPTDEAWLELAAGAMAACAKTGYMTYGSRSLSRVEEFAIPKDEKKQMERKQRVRPMKLLSQVNPIIDEILKIDSPYAQDTAAEFILQVVSESLGSGHCESHNGRREIEAYPPELTARAAGFLNAEDPFTFGVAEWAVSTTVCNEIEDTGGEAWPGENPPIWWSAWYGLDPAKDMELEYIRQAVQLQMHRSGADLLTLAADQMRRADARAAWSMGQLPAAQGAELEKRIAAMHAAYDEFAEVVEASPENLTACRKAFLQWRPTVRDVVMLGPDIDFDSVVYVTRNPGGMHGQPGSQQVWEGREGDIFVQNGLTPGSPSRAVIGDKMPPRLIGDMDLWYDGDKVVFCAAENRSWKLYEIDLNGTTLTKLPSTGNDDHNCAYLPDGGVVFASTGHNLAVMCLGGAKVNQSNIFRLDPEHKTIKRLTFSKDDDDYPYVLNDGRIVWMRWDYQERGVDELFSLWIIRPDGTGSDAYYLSHMHEDVISQTLRDAVPIPGSQKIIASGGSHRTGPEGTLVLGDPSEGINNPLSVRTVTPYNSPTTKGFGDVMRPVEEGGVPYPGGMVTTPFPLSEKSFLTPMSHDMPESNFWLYYVDVWGNKEVIHRDKRLETVSAFPLKARPKPPVLPDTTDPSKNYATLFVDNIYADLPGVESGEVKYLRILRNIGWPMGKPFHPNANPRESFGYPGTGGPIQVIGMVPVQEDGSANFHVPAEMDLYFQALDKDYRAVQRMRTHVEFARGEVRGCIGCHETRDSVVGLSGERFANAMNSQPVRPTPPPWGDTTVIDFETMIHPILEAKCVDCHGGEKTEAGLDLTAARGNQGFMQSYRSIWGIQPGEESPEVGKDRIAGYGKYFSDHPWAKIMADFVQVRESAGKEEQGIPNIPKRYGAIAHPFVSKLVEPGDDHAKLLTEEEKQLLMTWFDIQTPYFSVYEAWNEKKEPEPVVFTPPFGTNP